MADESKHELEAAVTENIGAFRVQKLI